MTIPRIAWAAYGFALAVIVLDQITKAMVLGAIGMEPSQIPNGYPIARVLPPVFNLTYVLNDGVSFGLFGGGASRWVLTVFSIAVSGLMAWWAFKAERRLLITAIGLIIGGALGNAIDRIRYGGVVDFLDFSGVWFPWIFNIADSAIFLGVVALVIDSFLSERAAKVGAANEKS